MTAPPSPPHPYASVLRQRAAHLCALAAAIERCLAMALPDAADQAAWSGARARLCERMLDRNLHQLHRAADDLRVTAMRFRQRADELDHARRAIA